MPLYLLAHRTYCARTERAGDAWSGSLALVEGMTHRCVADSRFFPEDGMNFSSNSGSHVGPALCICAGSPSART